MTELLVLGAALIAGALNAVAGGGTFIAFPVLLFVGVDPITANATSTIGVWPGALSSAYAYRKELDTHQRRLPLMLAISLAGSALGAIVLLSTPSSTFEFLIPWLLLTASVLFTLGPTITGFFRTHLMAPPHGVALAGTLTLQFIIAFYGGYFGAGIGILMLALLALLGMTKIHEMNALKTIFGAAINGVAVLIFIVSDSVQWSYGAIMIIGSIVGGYFGAHYAQKLPAHWVRRFVLIIAWAMTSWFFVEG